MSIELGDLLDAGVYPDSATAISEALRLLWQVRPAVRMGVAAHKYQHEGLSIAAAASVAGVSFDQMKEALAERGIPLRLGPETVEDARRELEALRKMRQAPGSAGRQPGTGGA